MAILSYGQLTDLWRNAGGDPLQADTAAAIALAESGGNTNAIHNTAYPNRPGYRAPAPGNQPEYSVGLWQINLLAHPNYTAAQMLTQAGNVRAAIAISGNGGQWSPWSTFTSGAYKQYLLTAPPPVPTTPPGVSPDIAAASGRSFRGWQSLSVALGVTAPYYLRHSAKARHAALQKLR